MARNSFSIPRQTLRGEGSAAIAAPCVDLAAHQRNQADLIELSEVDLRIDHKRASFDTKSMRQLRRAFRLLQQVIFPG